MQPLPTDFPAPDPRIVRFLRRHHVLTLATVDTEGQEPWCCNLFYALMLSDTPAPSLVFTSGETTRHGSMMVENNRVAGSVVLETRIVGKLQGVQFQGRVTRAQNDPDRLTAARNAYLKRFPYAAVVLKESELWILELTRLKYTDNTLGFGTKLHWPPE